MTAQPVRLSDMQAGHRDFAQIETRVCFSAYDQHAYALERVRRAEQALDELRAVDEATENFDPEDYAAHMQEWRAAQQERTDALQLLAQTTTNALAAMQYEDAGIQAQRRAEEVSDAARLADAVQQIADALTAHVRGALA